MQGELLSAARKTDPSIRRVFDPFVGSGTALTEAMMQGLDFVGFDVNPLAILLCRAKTIPYFDHSLDLKLKSLIARFNADRSSRLATTFPGWNKWFRRDVAIQLSRLRRAISADENLAARRFFWVALAETVRRCSNSRTSTFKLHIRSDSELLNRPISPRATFEQIAVRNLSHLRTGKDVLAQRNLILRGHYRGHVSVSLQDASALRTVKPDERCDLLLTSPPYGDNATTIPYGQHSYLPLQWIQMADIDPHATDEYLRTTHEIDTRSLGGSRAVCDTDTKNLRKLSRTFGACLRKLTDQPRDRGSRVTAFCRDLNQCIDPILAHLKDRAYMIWIVGNRKVAGMPFPLSGILSELLAARGATRVARVNRVIPSKRMAVRNDVAETMGREAILVFRKG